MTSTNKTACLLFALILPLYSCGGGGGGGGSDTVNTTTNGESTPVSRAAMAIQGSWNDSTCVPDPDNANLSVSEEYYFEDGQFTQSRITYLNSVSCSSDFTLTFLLRGTYSLTGEATPVASGDAMHIDLVFTRASATASQSLLDSLASRGTSLQAFFSEQGIDDINNIPLSGLVNSTEVFSIFRVDENSLEIGIPQTTGSGIDAASRVTQLNTGLDRIGEAPVIDTPVDDPTPDVDTNLPVNAQTGIPTTGNDQCTYVLDSDITSPTRLVNTESSCDYRLTRWVDVRSDLEIEPGVGIRADADARITVDGGRIIANGTARNPIVMDGNAHTAGYWRGINLREGRESSFNHFHLADAGQECTILFCPDVGFQIDEISVSITNSSVSNSYVDGMLITDEVELLAFSNNRFFNNQEAGLVVSAENIPMMDLQSNFSGGAFPNGIPMLHVRSGGHSGGRIYRWKNLEAPYYISGYFNPDGGIWRVEAGVEIVMASEAWITIEDVAVVEIDGTASQPVSIRGERSTRGYWDGIKFRDSRENTGATNRFTYTNISDFGNTDNLGPAFAAIRLDDSTLILENVNLTNGKGNGVLCDEPTLFSDGSFLRFSNVRTGELDGVQIDADCQDF